MSEQNTPHIFSDDPYGDALSGKTVSLAEAVMQALQSSIPCEEKRTSIRAGASLRGGRGALNETEVAGHLASLRTGEPEAEGADGNESDGIAMLAIDGLLERTESCQESEECPAEHLSRLPIANPSAMLVLTDQSAFGSAEHVVGFEVGDDEAISWIVERHLRALSRARSMSGANQVKHPKNHQHESCQQD